MINLNGLLVEESNPVLSSNNRAFKYGDGLFETLKVENGTIHFFEDHYFRLMASMRMLRMEIPMNFTMEFIESEILRTASKNNLENARVRMTVYRKEGGLYTPDSNQIEYLIETAILNNTEKENYVIDLFKDYYIYSGLLSTVKTTNRLVNTLAGIYASDNTLDNCILINEQKKVVEAINGNLFIVNGNHIKTPPITDGCVKGIIRKKLIQLVSKDPNYSIEEASISPFDLQKAEEVFITNTIVGIQGVDVYKKSKFKRNISNELKNKLKHLI